MNLLLVSVVWVYALGGQYFTHRFNSTRLPDDKTPGWGRALYYQLVALGLLYNIIFMHLEYYGVERSMMFLFMVSVGFSAGSVGAYQHLKWLSTVFIVSVISPQCIYYLMNSAPGSELLSFLMIVFIVFMSNVSLAAHKDALKTLSLTYELKAAKEKAEMLAITDMLTGLYNRRAFYEMGETLLANAKRHEHPISLIMLDIDHFKKINDTHGHATGDEVIKIIAERILNVARKSDLAARVGGEEFALLLPETESSNAQALAERLRKEIEKESMSFNAVQLSVTASLGVAQHHSKDSTLDHLLMKADQALYRAKEKGRDQVVVSS